MSFCERIAQFCDARSDGKSPAYIDTTLDANHGASEVGCHSPSRFYKLFPNRPLELGGDVLHHSY